ncbi:MAG: mandelate racemase/muconate lactonizing enzyme family protein [Capsulimonadales bacterium]|nr:mandelate racemase/muconate lactonizing enzyme family protein [Capsulimonadales bacterium]
MNGPIVADAERITLHVPFRERIADWNELLVHQWQVVEMIRLSTDSSDIVGWGETLPYYTWGRVTDDAIARIRGRRLFELLGDDSLGAGLQMAAYDAAGKAAGVPVHRLFNLPVVRRSCPIAWWNHDMPAELLAAEASDAIAGGYIAHKMKARPWIDLFEQIDAISGVTPPHYRIDMDWNDTLLSVGNAARILSELDRYERVALYEGPIPQRDIEGYQYLRRKAQKPIALHFGHPPFPTCVRAEMCDGFVVSGGVSSVLNQGLLTSAFDKSLFLQLVGTGWTTTMMAHLGAVIPAARWPAVTCMNNFSDDLLASPLELQGGYLRVPDGPGLGVEPDLAAIERFRVPENPIAPAFRLPRRSSILSVERGGGRVTHYASMWRTTLIDDEQRPAATVGPQLWDDFLAGNQPVDERGVRLTFRHDDGSAEWKELYDRAVLGPVASGV